MSSRSSSPGQLSLFEQERARTDGREPDEVVVRRLAERIVAEAASEPPVDVRVIASLRGIARIESVEQDWAGMLIPSPGIMRVQVRASDGWPRKRFTVAHEAIHTLLPGFTERQFRCNPHERDDWIETLCDVGASELLLPRAEFEDDLGTHGFSLDAVETLSDRYQTSLEATAIRTVELWPEPAAVLVLELRTKPAERNIADAEPKLRLAWSRTQGDWPFLLRHKSVEPSSAFELARTTGVTQRGDGLGVLATFQPEVDVEARAYGPTRVIALARQPRGAAA